MFEKIKHHNHHNHRFFSTAEEDKYNRKLIKRAREEQRRMSRAAKIAAKMNFTAFDSHVEHEYDMAE